MCSTRNIFKPAFLTVSLLSKSTLAFSPASAVSSHHFASSTRANTSSSIKSILKMSETKNEIEKEPPIFKLIHSRDVEAVRNAPQRDGKRPGQVSSGTFLLTAVVGVPLWLTVVMPLTVVYQVGKSFLSPKEAKIKEEALTQEVFPATEDLKPIQDRAYDAVLLGCTGFTGRLTAIYLAKTYPNLKWAIAGRSQAKLDKLKKELEDLPEVEKNLLNMDMIVVDTSKPRTLHKLVDDTKVVITTAGPFCKYGSNVVEFCARYGTNYVDITGEIDWNKEMIMKWDKKAQETGAKIISLCGHDSIPWDITYYKIAQLLRDECDDNVEQVRCYDDIKGGISGGTIDTALTMMNGEYEKKQYDFDPYYKKPNGSKSTKKAENISSQMLGQTQDNLGGAKKWKIPFLMSGVNAEVVKRSHALSNDADGQTMTYNESAVQPNFQSAFVQWFGMIAGTTALLNPITAAPMKKMLPKPGEGPDEKMLKYGYLLVSGVGDGANGSKVETAFYFPNDPGYKDTARMVSEAGLCLAFDTDKLPTQGGGFFSPSIGMGDALLERLCKTGCQFASRVVHGKIQSKL